MKKADLSSLLNEVSALTQDAEGLLKGGFSVIDTPIDTYALANGVCSNNGTCYGNVICKDNTVCYNKPKPTEAQPEP